MDAATSARQLHTALEAVDIEPPYVLAGHSYGGLVVRMFAHRYPTEVAGMALVDASHPDQRVNIPLPAKGAPSPWAIGLPVCWLASVCCAFSRARVVIGEALLALGDGASAHEALHAALRTFEDVGAAPDRHAVRQLLPTAVPGGLTPREQQVLGLIAAWDTNAEIAQTLVLSEKTVARHISNIFVKLGVSSRTAAAAYAFDHGLHRSPSRMSAEGRSAHSRRPGHW